MNQTVKNLKAQPENPVVSKSQPPEDNRRILIVDDELAIAEGIKALLVPADHNVIPFRRSSRSQPKANEPEAGNATAQRGGAQAASYEVVIVNHPRSALQAVQQALQEGRPFAMGFFDVLLGADIDGIELVRQIQAIDERMFAVFVTAYQDRSVDAINEFLGTDRSGRWDYINKPFAEGEIIQKARNATTIWNLQKMRDWQNEQLQEAQKMLLQNERANTLAAVGRSVAHEFGNLLMQIVGHAEIALLKKEPERMKQALETILKASDTASAVLDRFKKLAQGNSVSTDLKLINVIQPVHEALELMSYQFKTSQIQVDKSQISQVLFEGNKHSLVQVLMNLLINATHAMPNGGLIEVSTAKRGQDQLEIKVRDHGAGIPPEILPRVTEALFSTKGSKGSGLGLAICKEIIEVEHSGEFHIENHPQGGVVATVILPTRQEKNHAEPA